MAVNRGTRAQTVLVILVILVVAVVGLYCYFEFWRTEPPEPEQLVKIRVDLSESGEWESDLTDSSLYISTVTYVISNHGTETAEGIQATINIDAVVYNEFSLASLASKTSFTDEFSFSMNCDSSQEISLKASCGNSTDTGVFTVNAFLDRTFNPDLASLYITPSDSIIQQTLDEIVNNPLIPDWIEIRDWVANEIEYYVVVGEKEGMYHAWVKLNVDIIGWQNIEPQAGGLNTLVGDFLSLSDYTAKYNFNDVYLTAV
jgi:hypothetical protein